MTAESREELISAYLDGELSDDERAVVDKALAEDPRWRQLHEELLALRAGIQSLARHELDHDISGAVLRRAEQSVLRGGDPPAIAGTIRPSQRAASWWNRGAGWRRVVWPALAVAAALVILVYDANRRSLNERQVAQAPEAEKPADAAPRAEGSIRAAEREPTSSAIRAPSEDRIGKVRSESEFDVDAAAAPQGEAMPKDGARSGAAAPALAPQESAASPASPTRTRKLLEKQSADGVVFQCSTEYLRERTFEKLLDEKKIKWERASDNETREKKAGGDADAKESASVLELAAGNESLRATYVVDATREQVGEILAELEKNARPDATVKLEYLYRQLDKKREANRQSLARAPGGAARGITITLVAPATASPPAAPANSAP